MSQHLKHAKIIKLLTLFKANFKAPFFSKGLLPVPPVTVLCSWKVEVGIPDLRLKKFQQKKKTDRPPVKIWAMLVEAETFFCLALSRITCQWEFFETCWSPLVLPSPVILGEFFFFYYRELFVSEKCLYNAEFPLWFYGLRQVFSVVWAKKYNNALFQVHSLVQDSARDSFGSNKMCQFFVKTYCLWHKQLENEIILGGHRLTVLHFQKIGPNIAIFITIGLKPNFETWMAIFKRFFLVWKLVEKIMFWHIFGKVVSL